MNIKNSLRIFLIAIFLLAFLSGCGTVACPPQGNSLCDPQLPSITSDTGWWVDMTGQVSQSTIQALQQESVSIQNDGFQLAGVIVANAASDPSKVASDFGNKNGIGSSEKDNGVVIVVLLDKEGSDGNKPYIFIAPGKGLSGLTATKLGQVRDNVFVPARANGKWEEGLVATVKAVHALLLNPNMTQYASPTGSSGLPGWAIVLLVILLFIIVVGVAAGGGLNSGGDSSDDGGFFGGGGGGFSLGGGGGFGGSGAGG